MVPIAPDRIVPRSDPARVLVITTEPLPLPAQPTTGAGLRAWGLAMGLRSKHVDAIITTTAESQNDLPRDQIPQHVRICRRAGIPALIGHEKPDCIVLQHWGLASEIPDLQMPLAIDLAGPHLLERVFWGEPDISRSLDEKLAALRRADFLTCSGEFQKHYFYPYLLMAGFDLQKADLPVIPFSVPPLPSATAKSREEFSFVYGGAFLPWQNPERAITWLLDEFDKAKRGRLYFYGGVHPELDVSRGRFAQLHERLQKHPRVELRAFTSFDELMTDYRGIEVALDLMERNPERELAFATRTMMYLYCGVPAIHNNYSELAGVIASGGCGWTVSPDDEQAFRATVRRILARETPLAEMSEKARETAARFSWDKTISPLAEFCKNPFIRAEKVGTFVGEALRHELDVSRRERDSLRSQVANLQGKFALRVQRKLSGLGWLFSPIAFLFAWPVALFLRRSLLQSGKQTRSG